MTPQAIFDKVAKHLLKQGCKSMDGDVCRYRHGKLRCAAGVLIPAKLYSASRMEGASVSAPLLFDGMPEWWRENISLIRELQIIHDNAPESGFREYVTRRLRGLASDWGLNSNEVPSVR